MPLETRELWITMLRQDEVPELASLGQRLRHLQKLTLKYGDVEDVNFLEFFDTISSLKCLLADLKDFKGIGFCTKLTSLNLGASLSSVGSLSFLEKLPCLEQLSLEGPNPSKGLDQIKPILTLKALNLYAPKWNLKLLPEICPALETLGISQGSYQSLDFIAGLKNLITLDIAYARKLTDFQAIGEHKHLQSVRIGYAITSLESCSQFGCSSSIQKITMVNCKNLSDISALNRWPVLQEVEFIQCPNIPALQMDKLRKTGKKVNGK